MGRRLTGGVFISSSLAQAAAEAGFEEIVLPSLEPASIYTEKAGQEILGQMYTFPDKKGRTLCLRPEGTATCQILADTVWKSERNINLFYLTTCWRYERPQAGRYREFLQFGVEVLNPRPDRNVRSELLGLAENMIRLFTTEYEVNVALSGDWRTTWRMASRLVVRSWERRSKCAAAVLTSRDADSHSELTDSCCFKGRVSSGDDASL